MVRKVNEEFPIHKHTLNLYKGDYEKLQSMFPDLGAGVVIRRVVRNYIESLEEKTRVALPVVQLEIPFND